MSYFDKVMNGHTVIHEEYSESVGFSLVQIKFNNYVATGVAYLHPDDEICGSRKIGHNIAYSRAMINLIEQIYFNMSWSLEAIRHFYNNSIVAGTGEIEANDPSGAFTKNYLRMTGRCNSLKRGLKTLKQELKEYIINLDKVFTSIKSRRQTENLDKID